MADEYAQIREGRVRLITTTPNPVGEFIKITNLVPKPQAGWMYDEKGFVAPAKGTEIITTQDKAATLAKSIDTAKLEATEEGKALKALLMAILNTEL